MSDNITKETTSFFEDIKSTIMQRFGSHLYVCISGSFIIDNWEDIFYLVVSNASVSTRLNYIHKNPFSIINPVLCGVLIVILIPFAIRIIEIIHLLSDFLHNKISFIRDSHTIKNMGRIKALDRQETFERDRGDAINKANLDKIEANSKYDINKIEDDYRMASVRFKGLSDQVSEYQDIVDSFLSDINHGIMLINDIERALNNSLPYLNSLTNPDNQEEAVLAHNEIMSYFKNIDIDKINNFLRKIPDTKNKPPEKTPS
ncbi:hypothetical protein F652_2070 [Enterobacteriaceae bacterium bta3-1]|nr:hypothetical protein F652_2070 [Enterobacteriaceae bacterium bta3-1]